jgi:hypothetical protein
MTTSLGTTVLIGLLVLAALGLVHVWTSGMKAGRKVERQVREFTRMSQIAGGAFVASLVITGAQWFVVTHTQPSGTWAFVLGVPAMLAGVTVGQLLALTDVLPGHHGHRGVRR